jgi:hypothetical protein
MRDSGKLPKIKPNKTPKPIFVGVAQNVAQLI